MMIDDRQVDRYTERQIDVKKDRQIDDYVNCQKRKYAQIT